MSLTVILCAMYYLVQAVPRLPDAMGANVFERPIDVFLLAGQSNAWGKGDVGQAPRPRSGHAFVYCNPAFQRSYTTTWSDALSGFVCESFSPNARSVNMASIIPSFQTEYVRRTRRKICIVQWAIASSSLFEITQTTAGNWGPTGSHRYASILLCRDAMEKLKSLGYAPRFQGVIWMQGEAENQAMAKHELSAREYKRGLTDLINFFKSHLPAPGRFYMVQTGRYADEDHAGFIKLRHLQKQVCELMPESHLVYDETHLFPERGWMADNIHYDQRGLNDIGRKAATRITTLSD